MTTERSGLHRILDELPPEEFVRRWRALVGEPPAVLLDDRAAMIEILVQSAGAPSDEEAE